MAYVGEHKSMNLPQPPRQSPTHRAEQITFEINRIMREVRAHEAKIKELQSEVRTLVEQVKGWL